MSKGVPGITTPGQIETPQIIISVGANDVQKVTLRGDITLLMALGMLTMAQAQISDRLRPEEEVTNE